MNALNESAEDIAQRATANLALLIRYAQASAFQYRGSHPPRLLRDQAWSVIAATLISTRNDVMRLFNDIENLQAERSLTARELAEKLTGGAQ
jgi:hypothetical protein